MSDDSKLRPGGLGLNRPRPGEYGLRDLGRGTLQGALLGWGDEATAATAATLAKATGDAQDWGSAYNDILRNERGELARFQREAPGASLASEFAGSALPAAALTRAASLISDPRTKVRALRAAIRAAKSPTAQGTALGAVSGAGTAEEGSRGSGAAVGAVIGGAATKGAELLGKGLRWIGRQMGLTNVDKDTAAALLEALRKDGIDPKEVLQRAADLSSNTQRAVTLADVLADMKNATNTTRLIDQSLAQSGGHKQILADALTDRLATQKDRVLGDVSDAIGKFPEATRDNLQQLIDRRRQSTAPLYAKAFGNKTRLNLPELQELHNTGGLDDAFERFRDTMRVSGKPIPTRWATDSELDDIPKVLIAGEKNPRTGKTPYYSPTLEHYHEMKQHLWDLRSNAMIKNPLGEDKATRLSMAYDDARTKLRDILQNIGGEDYKRAEALFGGESKLIEAARFGSRLFKEDPAKIRAQVAKMDPAEREALLSGFAGMVNDMPLKDGADFAKQILGDSKKLERLQAIMPDAPTYERFVERLKTESMLTRGATSYPGAAPQGPSMLTDAIAAARMAKGDTRGAALDALRNRVHIRPQRESQWMTEFAFGRPGAAELDGVARRLTDPAGAATWADELMAPLAPAVGAVSPLGLLGQRDPEFSEDIRRELDAAGR